MSRYIDADALLDKTVHMAKECFGVGQCYCLRTQFQKMIEDALTIDAVPVAYCQFKKNASGVNRYCTKCGAYLEDREYENHTIKFCYYCGSRVVLESEKENGTAK